MYQIITKSGLSKIKIPGEVIAPQKKIQTLQNSRAEALLFSIGTDNQLYCLKENSGNNKHQWSKIHLSTTLGGKVIDFALSCEGQKLDLIVAVEVAGKHKVYTSIANNLEGDFKQTTWKHIEYDDKLTTGELRFSTLIVKQLDIQTINGTQYISVFVDDQNRIFKYYIELEPDEEEQQNNWNPRQFAVDYNKKLVDSCIGKPEKGLEAGLYTLGIAGNKDAILFTPLYNSLDLGGNPPVRPLHVGKDGMNALASVKVTKKETDLFVAGQGQLYHFPYDKQTRDSEGTLVFEHELFKDVKDLYAVYENNQYIIWGRNKQKEIFYTLCSKNQISNPKAWSNPVVLNKGVVQFTSFFNSQTKEITYFALKDSNELIYAVRSPKTTVWRETNVVVPTTDSAQFESTAHVGKILVTDKEGRPQRGVQVSLQAVSPCRVYVNNLFTLLDGNVKKISTDRDGLITIVEPTDDLEGTSLKVRIGTSKEALLNPMNNSMEKLSSLKTTGDLSKIGVDSSTSNEAKKNILNTIQKMSDLYVKMPIDDTTPAFTSTAALTLPSNQVFGLEFLVESGELVSESLTGIGDFFKNGIKKIASFAGDVANAMKNFAGKVAKVAIGFAKGAWRMVTKIAGKIYHFVLDTAASIASSIGNFIRAVVKEAKKWIDKFLDISKGVGAYIFSESSFNPSIEIAGQTFSSSSNQYGIYQKEIAVRDIFKNSITLKAKGVTKTAKVDPFTGLLFSLDLGHMLHTPSVITNDCAVSYGLYDAGMGLRGLTDKNQVYLYVSKNHSNWLEKLIAKHPNKEILISDLVLAGSHDSGMYLDIPTEVAIKARLLLIAAGFLVAPIPRVQLLAPAIFAAALVYDPKKISRNVAVTQKESITNQLKLGVRFFDFRPGYNILHLGTQQSLFEIIMKIVKDVTANTTKGELESIGVQIAKAIINYVYTGLPVCHIHAVIPGIELKQMISETVAFLEQNPKEVVVIEMKHNGIEIDKIKTSYDVVDKIVNSHLGAKVKKVNIVETGKGITSDYSSWETFNSTKVKDLIKDNKRLVIAYEQGVNDSYNDYAYSLANPDYVINGYTNSENKHEDGLVDTISKSTDKSLSIMQLQGTFTNALVDVKNGNTVKNIAELALALASTTNAGSYLLATKGKMDSKTYPWLREQLVTNGKGKGTMVLLNDFVDSMLGATAVEATDKRLQNK